MKINNDAKAEKEASTKIQKQRETNERIQQQQIYRHLLFYSRTNNVQRQNATIQHLLYDRGFECVNLKRKQNNGKGNR